MIRRLMPGLLSLLLAGPAASAAESGRHTLDEQSTRFSVEAAWPESGHAAVDGALDEWVYAQVAEVRRGALAYEGTRERPWSFGLDYRVLRNDTGGFVVRFDGHTDTAGAHPIPLQRIDQWQLPAGERLDLIQVVDGEAGLRRLSNTVIERLIARLPDDDARGNREEMIRDGAAPEWSNFANFALLTDRLYLLFPSYQVAPYSSGPQELEIPLGELEGVLRSQPGADVPAFDCARAEGEVEQAICKDAALARLDRELALAHAAARARTFKPEARAALEQAGRDWRRARDACSGSRMHACIEARYRERILALDAAVQP